MNAHPESPPRAPARPDFPPLPALLHQRGVMLVDDHRLQRDIGIDLLRAMGVQRIYEAADGEQALQMLGQLDPLPALLLLDLEMPRMDGFETLRQLAASGLQVPVMVVSGGDLAVLDSIPALAEELGVVVLGASSKPLDSDKLRMAFERAGRAPRPLPSRGRPTPGDDEVGCEELHQALAEAWIVPDYQPKLCLQGDCVDGVEALARWREPGGRQVSPAQFIAVAEREGRIDELTLRMLDGVLADLCAGLDGGAPLRVSINVSAHSLSRAGFVDDLRARIDAAGFSPGRFILEITESALASDTAQALCALGRLRLQGFGLSIDDYGTGFSSLQQLARMPFSELKIDRSFVRLSNQNARQRTILGSAIDVGRRLGVHTVAEGVETVEELELLKELGCTHAQGFLLARPMSAIALRQWLRDPAAGRAGICGQQP